MSRCVKSHKIGSNFFSVVPKTNSNMLGTGLVSDLFIHLSVCQRADVSHYKKSALTWWGETWRVYACFSSSKDFFSLPPLAISGYIL
jgi:hypothetical protein